MGRRTGSGNTWPGRGRDQTTGIRALVRLRLTLKRMAREPGERQPGVARILSGRPGRGERCRRVGVLVGLFLIAAMGGLEPSASTASAATPNVVIILADDLGWGDVRALYSASGIATPHIGGIASAGMRFTDAHSPAAVCSPTRYGLLTGRYAWRTWLRSGVLGGRSNPLIEADRPTLGTLLKARGYRTAAIGKWHLGLHVPMLPESQRTDLNNGIDFNTEITGGPVDLGFDEFFGLMGNIGSPYAYIRDDLFTAAPTHRYAPAPGSGLHTSPTAPDFDPYGVLDRLTEEAVDFIARGAAADAPFFLYFSLTAPHTPLIPADRFHGRTRLGNYGDFVAQVDWSVGQVLDALSGAGVSEDTLVIFTSDNGSRMAVRDARLPDDHVDYSTIPAFLASRHRANGPWRGLKGDIYEGGHRVPLLVRWPGRVESGSTSAEFASLTDLYATLADIVNTSPGAAGDGVSLLPALDGGTVSRPTPGVLHSANGTFAIRDGAWKLVLGNGSGGWYGREKGTPFKKPWQLFDLSSDPDETVNLVDDHTETVERLEAALLRIRSSEGQVPASYDATLASLTLSDVDLGEFSAHTTAYAGAVDADVEQTTVEAGANHAEAEVVISPTDSDTDELGHQVALEEGENRITVRVTAEERRIRQTYTVKVTRGEVVPLTASFEALPTAHEASGTFVVRVRFSEPVVTSYATLRDRSFDVTNGDVRNARRVDGRNDLWELDLAPSSDEPLTVTLPVTIDCAARGAVCTEGGKALSAVVSATVPGPAAADELPMISVVAVASPISEGQVAEFRVSRTGATTHELRVPISVVIFKGTLATTLQGRFRPGERSWVGGTRVHDNDVVREDVIVTWTISPGEGYTVAAGAASAQVVLQDNDAAAPLTAQFIDMPQTHDGVNPFIFELRFSEQIEISYVTLRDRVFDVIGGSVMGARRLERSSSIRWEIKVQPTSNADVLLTLPASDECTAVAAICTPDGRRLSGRLRATLAGPAAQPSQAAFPQALIVDAALRLGIADALGKAAGAGVSVAELAGLETLVLRDRGIRDLSGLEGARSLRTLDLAFNPLRDLGPLARLEALESLNLDGAAPDPWALPPLPGLSRLSLRRNGIEDLWALAGRISLTDLDVGENRIVDLWPLAGLNRLEVLRADGNAVSDLTPLASITALRTLDLATNRIGDVYALGGLERLETLRLDDNRLRDANPLSGLKRLRELGLAANPVAEPDPP